jgi:hypothetical protein
MPRRRRVRRRRYDRRSRRDDDWTGDEKAKVAFELGEGALHGPLGLIAAGVIGAIILWWRSDQKRRNADAN